MLQSNRIWKLAMLVLALLPIPAFAHTGVGHTTGFMAGFSHPISGADHLLAMFAVGLWASQMGSRSLWVVPSTFVALMLFGGLLGISNMPVLYVEQGIVASVFVLGVLIAGAIRFPLAISCAIVGVFAIFHGHAHGAEMPLAIGAVSYSAGFALATALLHVGGILAGYVIQKLHTQNLTRFAGTVIALSGAYLAIM